MTKPFRVPLGCKARHIISGMEGIVTAQARFLTGCDQVCIKPMGLDDKKQPYDGQYFDEPFVEIIDANVLKPVVPRGADDGCDSPAPSRR